MVRDDMVDAEGAVSDGCRDGEQIVGDGWIEVN